MNAWFKNCTTLKEGTELYRHLCKQHHPDAGGDTRTMQEINEAWSVFARTAVRDEVNKQREEKGWSSGGLSAEYEERLHAVLQRAMELNISLDLIGTWLYIYEYGWYDIELTVLGFWYSKKQDAYIWNGEDGPIKRKANPKFKNKDDLTAVFGLEEKRKQAALAAEEDEDD